MLVVCNVSYIIKKRYKHTINKSIRDDQEEKKVWPTSAPPSFYQSLIFLEICRIDDEEDNDVYDNVVLMMTLLINVV